MPNGSPSRLALSRKFLQRGADEDAEPLVGCADDRLRMDMGRGVHVLRMRCQGRVNARRLGGRAPGHLARPSEVGEMHTCVTMGPTGGSELLTEFRISSQPGNERVAAARVIESLGGLHLDQHRLDRLHTAVAEATLNAMEHGNAFRADRDVDITVSRSEGELSITITDQGCGPSSSPVLPDLQQKLTGEQSPRGWGLFLIRQMVDRVSDETYEGKHTFHLALDIS
jgi:serine/threonine-protein kinase RsbW